jgi:hypothetical protein
MLEGVYRVSLWDSYNVAHPPISKTYAPDAIPPLHESAGILCALRCVEFTPDRARDRVTQSSCCKEHFMLDFIMLALGLGFFALSVGYAYACDRL